MKELKLYENGKNTWTASLEDLDETDIQLLLDMIEMKSKQGNLFTNCHCHCHDSSMYLHPEEPCMDCGFNHIGERHE